MSIKLRIVTLITFVTLAAGCDDNKASHEPGPLERTWSSKPTLTATVPPPLELAPPKPAVPTQGEQSDANSTEETKQLDAEPESDETLYEPTLQSDDGITIHRLLTAPEVEAREPVAVSAVFAHHAEKIHAFLDVSNESSEGKTLTVFFVAPSGEVRGGVELTIPPGVPRWRTWAYTRLVDEIGLWRVEVRTSKGVLVGALPFEVAAGC